MSARRRQQPKAVPRRSLTWTKRAAILTALGVVVAIAIPVVTILITSHQGSTSQPPSGVAVNTVPVDRIGGAPILPVAATVAPSAYLPAGVQLYIDCLQPAAGKYLLARISYGQYKNEWIDI